MQVFPYVLLIQCNNLLFLGILKNLASYSSDESDNEDVKPDIQSNDQISIQPPVEDVKEEKPDVSNGK